MSHDIKLHQSIPQLILFCFKIPSYNKCDLVKKKKKERVTTSKRDDSRRSTTWTYIVKTYDYHQ